MAGNEPVEADVKNNILANIGGDAEGYSSSQNEDDDAEIAGDNETSNDEEDLDDVSSPEASDDEDEGEDGGEGQERAPATQAKGKQGADKDAPPKQIPDKEAAIKYRQLIASTIPAYQRRVQALETENKTLKQDTQIVAAFKNAITQYGLDGTEARLGLQMAAMWKASPKQLLGHLLAQAKSKGIEIDGQTQAGIDQNAVQNMIQAALAPVLNHLRPQQEQQQTINDRTEEVNQLCINYPDAAEQALLISEIALKENCSMNEAYFRAKALVGELQLDWNQDIPAQLAARSTKKTTTSRVPNVSSRRSSAPHVNGASEKDDQFDISLSNKQITRLLMKEAGIQA